MQELALWFVTADIPLTKDNVRPGWLAMGIVALLGVAVVVLIRSFIKHAKKAAEPWESDSEA